jgi:hypothetical protein
MFLDTLFSHSNVQQNQDRWRANLGGFLDTPFFKLNRKSSARVSSFRKINLYWLRIAKLKQKLLKSFELCEGGFSYLEKWKGFELNLESCTLKAL